MAIDKILDLPYAFEKVWDASLLVVQHAGWNLTKAEKREQAVLS